MACCTDECYENSCTDIKTRIFLIAALIVVLALILFSIYLVAKPVVCKEEKIPKDSERLFYAQYYKGQPQCKETSVLFHPQVVSILENDTQTHICSGVIVSENWLITAAHCLVSCKESMCNNFIVRAGSTQANRGGIMYIVLQFVIHPAFNSTSLQNNIGLIRVKAFDLNSNTIKIAKITSAPIKPGKHAELLGWFPHSRVDVIYRDNVLRTINLTIQSDIICRYRMKGGYTKLILDKYMLCGTYPANGGGCYTDAGGPLMLGNVITGVALFGQICYSCDYHMSVLTDIYYFRDFIKKFTFIEEIDIR